MTTPSLSLSGVNQPGSLLEDNQQNTTVAFLSNVSAIDPKEQPSTQIELTAGAGSVTPLQIRRVSVENPRADIMDRFTSTVRSAADNVRNRIRESYHQVVKRRSVDQSESCPAITEDQVERISTPVLDNNDVLSEISDNILISTPVETPTCCERVRNCWDNFCLFIAFVCTMLRHCLFRWFCCCLTSRDDKELHELEHKLTAANESSKILSEDPVQLSNNDEWEDPRKEVVIEALTKTFKPCAVYGFKRGLVSNVWKIGKALKMIRNTMQGYIIDEAARRVTEDIEQGRATAPILEVENNVYSDILYHVVTRLDMDEEKLQGIYKFCYENREGKTRLTDKDNGYCEIVVCFWGVRKRELIYKTIAYKAAIDRVLAERDIRPER
ncbi:hypothetical protein ElyMa_006018300 [Elysia marginata]|uniref:Annexin n=1 Tax=Elysia marginata TaxID=1093978 RepID=A0AAV4GJ26_9GAST|nr:hypothetical protein ElyMa_006018300 [Elysia marginata]